jgi:PAS domain S-box-containing protein
MPELKPDDAFHREPEWCRATLARIGDAVIATDTEGRVTFLNPVAESLTGWTQNEAAGVTLEKVFKIINQGTRQTVESPTIRALRDGVIVGLGNQTVLIAKDGTERAIGPTDDGAAPIRNHQGELAGVLLVFRDISELYRKEQHLQDALTYADNIIATMREPFVVLNNSLRIRTANRSFYQTFDTKKEETENRFLYDLGDGQWNIPRLRTLLEEVLSNSHPVHDFEMEHDFPAIGKKTMLLNASRFQSVDSQPEMILLAIEDISERKQAEVAVQTSEVRYRRLFETAKDGILILDANTLKIIDANPYMTELLGYTHDEFLGKELWEIGFFGDKRASQAVYRELQENGYVRYDHLPLETKKGEQAEVEFVSNVYQVDHRPIAQCNIRDISERSQLERELNDQREALADLHRRKDEFLAMLSHELRNPLAPISNAVHLLRLRKNEDSLQQKACIIIERQVTQLTRLVDDLMEVSRITTGRVRLRLDRVVVGGIVERAVETARPLLKERTHELTVSLPPQPIWLYADASRLEQVVVNLLTNAAKYTDEGGHIWLTVQEDGDDCVLRVRDTGIGIAPELLPRIFDLFTQAERSLDRSQGGLGIGLALVQRLVEMHKGKVEVHSSLGQGSEFVVRLPLALTPAPQSPAVAEETGEPPSRPLRVLVVDDNVDAAETLGMLLQESGHDVRTAFDGPTALEVALEYRPEVVLLDIGLPGLDGFEVAKRLRQQPALGSVVLVAMTGYGQDSDRQRSLDAGFDHHLSKPADFGKVQDILATVSAKAT